MAVLKKRKANVRHQITNLIILKVLRINRLIEQLNNYLIYEWQ